MNQLGLKHFLLKLPTLKIAHLKAQPKCVTNSNIRNFIMTFGVCFQSTITKRALRPSLRSPYNQTNWINQLSLLLFQYDPNVLVLPAQIFILALKSCGFELGITMTI